MAENAAVLPTETELVQGSETQPNAAEQKPAAAPGTQTEGDDEHDQPGTGQEGGWKRVKRQRDQARQDADYWRAEALKHQRATQPAPAAAAPAEVEEPEPKSTDFATTEEYLTAVRAWDRKQIIKDVRADLSKTEQQRNAEKQQKERVDAHFQREQQFAEANPQYHEKVGKSDIQISAAMKAAILESENGPAMALYLAEHPEEADAIREMPPLTAARAMGKIEASLAQEPTPAAGGENPVLPPISKAPTPINPIRKTSSVSGKPDPLSAAAPQLEFEKEMNKRQFGK